MENDYIKPLVIMGIVIGTFAFAIGLAWILVEINSLLLYIVVPFVLIYLFIFFLNRAL